MERSTKTPGLAYDDWNQIQSRISALIAQAGVSFVQGEVIKRDDVKKLVWIEELGTTPIPIIGFDYEFLVYDETPTETRAYTLLIKPKCPDIGDTILVALHLGAHRLPKCIGKIQSKDWIDV